MLKDITKPPIHSVNSLCIFKQKISGPYCVRRFCGSEQRGQPSPWYYPSSLDSAGSRICNWGGRRLGLILNFLLHGELLKMEMPSEATLIFFWLSSTIMGESRGCYSRESPWNAAKLHKASKCLALHSCGTARVCMGCGAELKSSCMFSPPWVSLH